MFRCMISFLVQELTSPPDFTIRSDGGLDVGHGNHRLSEPVDEVAVLQVLHHKATGTVVVEQILVRSHQTLATRNVLIILSVELVWG